MPLFRLENDRLAPESPATFRDLNLYERGDLQRLLRAQPEALGEELLIISEEFGDWQNSSRRLDLLALDEAGRLVVIELKRTEDGGHMELQALRYAAMVSSMTFDDLVGAHAAHHKRVGTGDGELASSRTAIADFLGAEPDQVAISSDVRIILVSANFGREITTAVLWLNRFEGMDIRCIRLKPYDIDGQVLIDIDQVIPLPEAASYQIKIGRKDAARARGLSHDNRDFTKYVIVRAGSETPPLNKRNAVREMVQALFDVGITVENIRTEFADRIFRTVDGTIEPGQATFDALLENEPELDVKRYFTEYPFHEGGKTHVLFKMWGRNTEQSLSKLRDLVGDHEVDFRAVGVDE